MGRKVLVLQVLDGFLESNNVPSTCNVFLRSIWSSSSWSRFPAQNADSCLFLQAVRPVVVKLIFKQLGQRLLFRGFAEHGCNTTGTIVDKMAVAFFCGVRYYPRRVTVSYGRDVLIKIRENLII